MQTRPRGLALAFGWRRLVLALSLGTLFGVANSLPSTAPSIDVTMGHAVVVSLVAVLAFGLFEQRPVAVAALVAAVGASGRSAWSVAVSGRCVARALDLDGRRHSLGARRWPQMKGLLVLIVEGLLFGPWIALGAMLRQRDVFARDQALAFELERSELERKALDARAAPAAGASETSLPVQHARQCAGAGQMPARLKHRKCWRI